MSLEQTAAWLEKAQNRVWGWNLKVFSFWKTLLISAIQYAIISYIFISWIYPHGRDYAFIILGIGIILFGFRQRTDGELRDLEIIQLRQRIKELEVKK